ncbi:MAG: helix-turn-helix transcriptional regulator [Betaproteobacteria bacterium]|nr:helix-turn-helix transcriptional regulator [Betaproteobacteria bacterium]
MSKSSLALTSFPPEAASSLITLGEQLALARLRRNESQRQWAIRIGVSVPTLIRMERGDPSVSIGVYTTALWLLGLSSALGELANPVKDLGALEAVIRETNRIRATRKQASKTAQMGKVAKNHAKP